GVIGHEYPGPVPKLLGYGLASLVTYSRVRAEQHFPADVFVGSVVGSLIAQQVYSIIMIQNSAAMRGATSATCSAAMDSRHHRIKDRLMCRRIAGCTRRWIAWLG